MRSECSVISAYSAKVLHAVLYKMQSNFYTMRSSAGKQCVWGVVRISLTPAANCKCNLNVVQEMRTEHGFPILRFGVNWTLVHS